MKKLYVAGNDDYIDHLVEKVRPKIGNDIVHVDVDPVILDCDVLNDLNIIMKPDEDYNDCIRRLMREDY